jgi:hypothetical protein
MKTLTGTILAGLLAWPLLVLAEKPPTGMQEDVQNLKKQVLELNRDLFLLEEELLFPSNTQVSVFLSMDVGTFFQLDSVSVKLDGKEVASYLYTPREIDALIRGGVQRIHIGNIKNGEHELVAFLPARGRTAVTIDAAPPRHSRKDWGRNTLNCKSWMPPTISNRNSASRNGNARQHPAVPAVPGFGSAGDKQPCWRR